MKKNYVFKPMQTVVQLLNNLEISNKSNAKMDALVRFFQQADDKDKVWLMAIFTGKRPKRPVSTTLLKQWVLEITQIPEWLFLECYSATGDLGEVLALLLPENPNQLQKPFYEWMIELSVLKSADENVKKSFVISAWQGLNTYERFIFNKLIGGSFRVGVSKKTLVNALAMYCKKEPNLLLHSIMGDWNPAKTSFQELINGTHINFDNSKPYPFCLAYALDKNLEELGSCEQWQIEYKWDGIRGQIIKRNHEIFIWSRGEELITNQFPELVANFSTFKDDFVIDGEILPVKNDKVLLFNDLQKRLNRKNVTKKLMDEVPLGFYAYDILEFQQENITQKPLSERRKILEDVFKKSSSATVKLSEIINFKNWNELVEIRQHARTLNSEGLMLKHKNSIYHVGRKKGDWFKWKVDPLTIDAVMIYAQKGSGRRSSKYTDYTFAVKNGDKLVTVAKAYSGLTDKEISEISKWVTQNEVEKFGPVRTVKPQLVFEIAFEGIAYSNRHKSGIALRFPRIKRWRKDKTVADIDTIESVKSLIES